MQVTTVQLHLLLLLSSADKEVWIKRLGHINGPCVIMHAEREWRICLCDSSQKYVKQIDCGT